MRVTIVNQHPSWALGGSETQCHLIAQELAARGHDVTYVALGGVPADLDRSGIGYGIRDADHAGSSLASSIVASRPDIVYWRANTRSLRRVARGLREAGVPLVFAASHVNDLRRWGISHSSHRRRLRRCAEDVQALLRSAWNHAAVGRADAIVVNNRDHLRLVGTGPASHIPNSVETRKSDFSWPRPYVAWVANLKPAKRPEALIPLASHLEGLGVDVLVVGAIQVPSYEWFTRPGLLPPNLHYLGPLAQEEANALLASALLHVHTCRPEGFPNVFLQAWHWGVPSVSLGFDPEGLIAAEGLGATCEDDADRFSAEVARLVEDDASRRAAGARAAALVAARVSLERNVAALEDVLRSVMSTVGSVRR